MAEHHQAEDLEQMLGYIGEVRDTLRMQNWDVLLHRTVIEGDDTLHARMWDAENHTTINIELGVKFFKQPPTTPNEVRDTIVHELVHAQHRDTTHLWESATLNNYEIPRSQAQRWDAEFCVFMERFVSWVARNITPQVPAYERERDYGSHAGCRIHDNGLVQHG